MNGQIMKKRILIVDDDLSILKLLNFILSRDYEVIVKNNGMEAFSWLEDGNIPELIISDLQMPYFDGQSFVKKMLRSAAFFAISLSLCYRRLMTWKCRSAICHSRLMHICQNRLILLH